MRSRPASQPFLDRNGSLSLQRARDCFDTGRVVEGISHLQQVLDAPADSFVASGDRFEGGRATAISLLNGLPPSAQRLYQTIQTPSAAAMLRDALAQQDLNRLGVIARRFPSTDPQFRALDRLAAVAFDRGDFGTAARLWDELLADPRHAGRITPTLVARMLVALRRSGRDGKASELAVRYSGMPVRVAGEPATVTSILSRIKEMSPPAATTGRFGGPAPGLTPPAYPPTWHRSGSAASGSLAELWTASRRSDARPIATAAGAVVAGGTLIIREPDGVRAFDLKTGDPVWHAPLVASAAELTGSDSADLHSLTRFEEVYAGNGVLGGLSTDGRHVYVLDRTVDPRGEVRTASRSPVPAHEQRAEGDQSNRLLAFSVSEGDRPLARPKWVVGGEALAADASDLSGHYFFGPPVVADQLLLAVTEKQQRLNLVALDAATGNLVWQQPLGFVPRSVGGDPVRAMSACPPAVSEGIAVCQTNAGFVVAVDVVTGQLLWSYDYAANESVARGSAEWSPERTNCYGDLSFPSTILIRDQNAVFLPHDSQRVHCLDLRSGDPRWAVPREDGFHVACLTDTAVVVAGRCFLRSLSIANGDELWSIRLGAPTGTGIVTDAAYLVPLETGLIASIDLGTGLPAGFDTPRSEVKFDPLASGSPESKDLETWRPGNLLAHDGSIYSVGPFSVTRLETAGTFLTKSPNTLDSLETARIELAAGDTESARPRLERLTSSETDGPTPREARRLLRELHYLRLAWQEPEGTGETLVALDRLSDSPATRGRFLLAAADRHLQRSNEAAVRRSVAEFSGLDLTAPLPVPSDATHLVTAASWVPAMLRRLDEGPNDMPLPAPLASLDERELRQRLLCTSSERHVAEIRLELARRAVLDGELHRAELLLLQAHQNGAFADAASRQLAGLRLQCGLDDVLFRDPAKDRRVEQVQITGRLWAPASADLCRTFGRSRRGFLTRCQEPFRVVDRGDSRRARLAIVDLNDGVCLGEIAVDARLRFPSLIRQPLSGHFLPVATSDRIYGLSLLEAHRSEPVWQAELPGRDGLLPQLGPYDSSFCAVQTRRELTVLDPETGDTIWQRTEVPPDRGLHGDHAAGLFGDRNVLVLLDADGASYTVFRTRTGERMSQGRLPIDHRRQRRAYGRKLFFIETAGGRSIARVWDPLSDKYELEAPFQGTLLQTSTRDDQLVLLFGDGRLMVFEPTSAQISVDLQLPPHHVGRPHAIQAFSDDERYYVSLYQADPDRFDESRVASYVYDTPLSTTHVQGRLLAIDRNAAAVAWSRPIEQRSILDPVEQPLPFLVAVARISDRRLGNRKTLLVEAIDKRTGVKLGQNDSLLPDQLLQVRHAADADRVELAGTTSTVVLDFSQNGMNRPSFAQRSPASSKKPSF